MAVASLRQVLPLPPLDGLSGQYVEHLPKSGRVLVALGGRRCDDGHQTGQTRARGVGSLLGRLHHQSSLTPRAATKR